MTAIAERILVSGSSGPIGAALLPALRERGYRITRLVRGAKSGADQISWDPATPMRPQSVSGFDAVIHLAGEPVSGRWTADKKRRILDSRALGTRHLAEALAEAPQRPQVLISASATGFYGDRGDEVLTEDSGTGKGFLAEVCREAEAAAQPAEEAGIRTAQLRIGLVMSPTGGALQKMLPPFRMGAGGRMGSGRQWWSWIDSQDLAAAILHILRGNLAGAVNLVAPAPATNAEFAKTLATVLHRPALFPMPAFVVRLAFGEMGEELLLASQRVQPAKLAASGFSFRHSDLTKALLDILKR